MLSDLRFTLRALGRARAFTLVAAGTLAIGIGCAAAIFSVTDWVLFRANEYPADVYLLGGRNGQNPVLPIRFDFMARSYAEGTDVMAEYARASQMPGNVVINDDPVQTSWLGVTANLLPMLGITPGVGRGFLPSEEVEGAEVAVVTATFARRHFGTPAGALGQTLTAGETLCTIVGVLRDGQSFPPYFFSDVYRPLAYRVDPAQPWAPNLFVLARLRAGVTREQAQEALQAVALDVPAAMRPFLATDEVVLTSLGDVNQGFRREIYWIQIAAVGLLYTIACLNASNLMLVRMLGRRRELSIRLALGGGRWRVIRLLAFESLLLALLGALGALAIANWLFPLLLHVAGSPAGGVSFATWSLDRRVLTVMGLLTMVTSLLIVSVPAWRILRADISSGLKDGGPALGESRALARLRGAFVLLQAALAVVLLTGAGLMIRTFGNLHEVDLGFDPHGRIKAMIGFPPGYPSGQEERLARLRAIQEELRRVPGVQAVGFGTDLLLPGYRYDSHQLEGPDGQPVGAQMAMFNRGYHEAAGLTLLRGQWLDQVNGNEVMVSAALARALWPAEDPVGRFVRPVGGNPDAPADWKGWVVKGVVGDVRSTLRDPPGNVIYGPEGWGYAGMGVYILRTSATDDAELTGLVRRRLYAMDHRIIVSQVGSISGVREIQLWAERLAHSALKVLAAVALLLTVVGLYSVLAYSVDRRMPEFGVRLALGASRRQLVLLVAQRGVGLAAGGIVLGLGGAMALTRYLESLLFQVAAHDPWVLAAVALLLLGTAVLACLLPARRAVQVDITRLMRAE